LVHPPASYAPGTISSLSMAFEDPDGSKLRMLLAGRYSYIHMAREHRSKSRSSITPAAKTTPTNILTRSPGQRLHRRRGRRNLTHPLHTWPNSETPNPAQYNPITHRSNPKTTTANSRPNSRTPSTRQGQESSRSLKLRKIPRPPQPS
jgi:hypothetical protein